MSGCDKDTCYAVVQGDKLKRLSFSRSLCDHIQSKTPGSEVRRVTLRVGKDIPPNKASPNGLYAVCKKSGWPLRVTMFQELAESWRHETRQVRECWIERDT